MGHADATLPIAFKIPTSNVLDAANAILRAGHGSDEDTPLEIVEQYLDYLLGGGVEIESTPDGITLNWIDDTSPLGVNLKADKERMNLIAPYVTGEASEPFIIVTWFNPPQRWVIRNKRVVVEQVAVEYKVIGEI